jgi:hypothetical protein
VAPARAPDELREGSEIGVVLDVHGLPEPALHLGGGVDPDPAGQDRGRPDRAGGSVDRSRQSHSHAEDPLAIDARLLQDPVDQFRRRIESLVGRVVDIQLVPGLRQHLVRQVGDGDAQMGVTEIDPEGESGGWVE